MSLLQDLPFGHYQRNALNNSISVYQKGINIHIEQCSKYPELEGHTWAVHNVQPQWVRLEKTEQIVYLDQCRYTLKFKDTPITMDELLKELQYKNAHNELGNLFYAKIKDGKYLANYDFKLHQFFCQNEENFFMLQDCLEGGNFCLPKDSEDRQRLLSHVAQASPHLAQVLESHAFSHEELHQKRLKP